MPTRLTPGEKRALEQFLQSAGKKPAVSPKATFFLAGVIAATGLVFLGVTFLITLKNLSDQIVYWVFLPGLTGGMGIIFLGIYLLKYSQKTAQQKRIAAIIRKLIEGETSSR